MLSNKLDIYTEDDFPQNLQLFFSNTKAPISHFSCTNQNFYKHARKRFIDAPWHSSRTFGATQEQKAISVAAVRCKLIGRSGNFAAQSDPPDFSCDLFVLATRPNWLEWCRISMSAHSWPHTPTQGVSTHLTARCRSFLAQKLSYCEQRSVRSACAQTAWAFDFVFLSGSRPYVVLDLPLEPDWVNLGFCSKTTLRSKRFKGYFPVEFLGINIPSIHHSWERGHK